MKAFRDAVADDLEGLIRLHDREIDGELVSALQDGGFPDTLALLPEDESGEATLAGMRAAVADLDITPEYLDRLAAEFAGVYLTGACGASPYESVWLHPEHLACQEPMFELRELYARAGLRVDDWHRRYDDHFVLQFQYLVRRLRDNEAQSPLTEIGRFIDEHVGFWLPNFAARLGSRCEMPFYPMLAALTVAWLEQLRTTIERITGEVRVSRDEVAQRIDAKFARAATDVAPVKFFPGSDGPSW